MKGHGACKVRECFESVYISYDKILEPNNHIIVIPYTNAYFYFFSNVKVSLDVNKNFVVEVSCNEVGANNERHFLPFSHWKGNHI